MSQPENVEEPPRINPWSIWLIVGIMLGGVLVAFNYALHQRAGAKDPRPPYLNKLEEDLEAVNRDGKPARLSQLKGKVYVASYLFTTCPMGCLGIAAKLSEIHGEFGDDPRFQLVSFSVDPSGDTPEMTDEFLNRMNVGIDDWWYLTGEGEAIPRYMLEFFQLYPTKKVDDPNIKFLHDMRVVLVDGKANIRGYYQLLHGDAKMAEQEFEHLRRDIHYILENETDDPAASEEEEGT